MPGPTRTTDELEILRVFAAAPDPAFVATEIAERFDVSDETARQWLNELVEKGHLKRKKPGRRTIIYWISESGREHYFSEADP